MDHSRQYYSWFGVIIYLIFLTSACSPITPLTIPTSISTVKATSIPTITLTPIGFITIGMIENETDIPLKQSLMSQEQILAVNPGVGEAFQKFQDEVKAKLYPSATFDAWGALATTQKGEMFATPFFEVMDNGNLVKEYVVIARADGQLLAQELKPVEVVTADGKKYLTLSQLVDAETLQPLKEPRPFIWMEANQGADAPIYFNGLGGIVPQVSSGEYAGGSKAEMLKMLAPVATATPEPTATTEPTVTPEVNQTFTASELENQKPETMPDKFTFADRLFTKTVDANGVEKWTTEDKIVEGVFYQPYQDKPIDFYFLSKSGRLSIYISPSSSVWFDLRGVKESDANSFVNWYAGHDVQYGKARARLLAGDQLEIVIGDTAHVPVGGGSHIYRNLGEGAVVRIEGSTSSYFTNLTGTIAGLTPYMPRDEKRVVCGGYFSADFLGQVRQQQSGDEKVKDLIAFEFGFCGANVDGILEGNIRTPNIVYDHNIIEKLLKIGLKEIFLE
jgi:hypothetical protein